MTSPASCCWRKEGQLSWVLELMRSNISAGGVFLILRKMKISRRSLAYLLCPVAILFAFADFNEQNFMYFFKCCMRLTFLCFSWHLLHTHSLGYPCPVNFNPADHFVHTLANVPGDEQNCHKRVQVSIPPSSLSLLVWACHRYPALLWSIQTTTNQEMTVFCFFILRIYVMLSVRMKQGKVKQTQGERRWDQFQQTVHDRHREDDITLQIMTFVPKHSKLVPHLCTPAFGGSANSNVRSITPCFSCRVVKIDCWRFWINESLP